MKYSFILMKMKEFPILNLICLYVHENSLLLIRKRIMSVWNKFYCLDSLDLVSKNNVFAQKEIIYGNNKNQVAN